MCAQTADPPQPSARDVVAALDAFLQVQAERAQHYQRFDEAHRQYLRSKAEGPYRYLMTQLTTAFGELSQRVIGLEQQLAGPLGQPAAAATLRELQAAEREKLRLTLALQALKAAHSQRRFSWQQAEGEAGAGGIGWPGHVCGVGCVHEGVPDEPTQAEYEGAVRETYQQLQAAITSINDAIQEVRQLRQELLEEMEEGEGEGEAAAPVEGMEP